MPFPSSSLFASTMPITPTTTITHTHQHPAAQLTLVRMATSAIVGGGSSVLGKRTCEMLNV